MSNYYSPCFCRIDSLLIPSYKELPCSGWTVTLLYDYVHSSSYHNIISCRWSCLLFWYFANISMIFSLQSLVSLILLLSFWRFWISSCNCIILSLDAIFGFKRRFQYCFWTEAIYNMSRMVFAVYVIFKESVKYFMALNVLLTYS